MAGVTRVACNGLSIHSGPRVASSEQIVSTPWRTVTTNVGWRASSMPFTGSLMMIWHGLAVPEPGIT